MAKNETVWGIDVGSASLKALRCRKGTEPGTLEVLQCEYIEHSKIMTQPGADPNEILAESLKLFLSRNNVKGEKIAISVSGQNALWRYQPLPPIDPKKVGDLIKYEVKQWLPFDLQDVIWDYRQVGGTMEGGVALDLRIFMYAMKRDIAKRTLERYAESGVEVDCIQGAQVALYNAFVNDMHDYDALLERDPNELFEYDVILNVGTDASEIVVTNGVDVWLRNIAVGGNMFTKALTKALKLTFSNAEHIKRNAATAQDPKAVVLAMKPVFNDMLTEIERSIKYYKSLNKNAKIRRVYALGNAMKLPGLRQFLSKSLGLDVVVPTAYRKLQGAEALANPEFRNNSTSFGVAYGLALQLLGEAPLSINLVPRDVVQTRLINKKKPWALAAASLLLTGMTWQYFNATSMFSVVENPAINTAYSAAQKVSKESKDLISKADSAASTFKAVDKIGQNLTGGVEGRITWMELLKAINVAIPSEAPDKAALSEGVSALKIDAITRQNRVYVNNVEVQEIEELGDWFELVRRWYYIDAEEAKAFSIDAEGNELTPPADAAIDVDDASASSATKTAEYVPEYTLEEMFPFQPQPEKESASSSKSSSKSSSSKSSSSKSSSSKSSSKSSSSKSSSSKSSSSKSSSKSGSATAGLETTALNDIAENVDARLELIPAPYGPGRIVQLTGYHYHNPDDANDPARGPEYLRRTILSNLKHGAVDLPISLERQRADESGVETVSFKDLGIYYPVLVNPGVIDDKFRLLDPQAAAEARKKLLESYIKQSGGAGGMRGGMNGGGMGVGMTGGGMGGGMTGGAMGGGMGGPSSGGASGGRGGMGGDSMNNQIANALGSDKVLNLRRYDFTIQFVWIETKPTTRDERRKAAEEAAKAAEEAESGATTDDEDTTSTDTTAPADTTSTDTATPADATSTDTTAPADATSTDTTAPADTTSTDTPAPADTTDTTATDAAAPAP
ncbi:MAG: pilus assembly protein PilM [Thermoguttaceae bacterium]|nr:pilus assembly protein PilM [Thermoguttaceae bacterium]